VCVLWVGVGVYPPPSDHGLGHAVVLVPKGGEETCAHDFLQVQTPPEHKALVRTSFVLLFCSYKSINCEIWYV
jgi:hypothetical protein